MISVLIAGSYTPVCLIVLKGKTGIILLSIVWAIAIAGILIKAFWVCLLYTSCGDGISRSKRSLEGTICGSKKRLRKKYARH